MKAMPASDNGVVRGHMIHCPACKCGHLFNNAEHPTKGGASWTFNGNTEKPTFTPSMLITWENPWRGSKDVCHSYVTDGKIQFLPDCTHALAGQTVDLEDV